VIHSVADNHQSENNEIIGVKTHAYVNYQPLNRRGIASS